MADEEIKKTTPKKRTTTTKAKVEEQPKTDPMVEQMQQMMAMMMAQQQQLMELMARTQQIENQVEEVEEEQPKPKKAKRERKDDKMNKQDLRRKYKDVDIYVTNVSQGMVIYKGRNTSYEWEHTGDIEIMTIDDIVNMPKSYLHAPWLCLDGYENEAELIDDIVDVLGLSSVYEYIYTLQDMEDNINKVKIEKIKRAVELSKKNGYDITMDMVVLVQRKIREGELTNYVLIGQLSELLGRKFL